MQSQEYLSENSRAKGASFESSVIVVVFAKVTITITNRYEAAVTRDTASRKRSK